MTSLQNQQQNPEAEGHRRVEMGDVRQMRSAMISEGLPRQDYDDNSEDSPTQGRRRMMQDGGQLDSSDEDESTLNTSNDQDGQERRTETFEEVSPQFKRRCKGFATIIVLCIFLAIVFVPSLMGNT